ncbi:hypothetical protein [Paenibacillus sp. LHD-38]|uniref:hypothetical protein n=1 Tax=Paenibacillus sp. LHD-38 TaxID=3072143 RepID=UPI00280FE15A|nr:hypothetical protein [Paenibacillus sp. LHD-38]MDQ8736482.1 hypothetical protein [Paenibacillus sp. LHD-38]
MSEKLEAINQNMLSVSNIYFLDSKIRDWLRNDARISEYERYKSLQEVIETVNQTGNYFK